MCYECLRCAYHAQVSPIVILADDVAQAAQRGSGVLVDCDLLIAIGRFTLA